MNIREKGLLVVGHLSLDRIKTREVDLSDIPGGAALYAAAAANVYGGKVGICAARCEDFPVQILKELTDYGVIDESILVLGTQRRSFMEYSIEFDRTTYSHGRKVWFEKTIEQTPRHLPKNTYGTVLLQPMIPSIQLEYAKWAKAKGWVTAADTSEYFAEKMKAEILELLEYIDIFLPSEVEMDYLFPGKNRKEQQEAVKKRGVSLLIVKESIRGSSIYNFRNSEKTECLHAGIRVTKAKDATGAGDTFNGGFLSAFCSGKDLRDSVRYGAALASVCVESAGLSSLLRVERNQIEDYGRKIEIVNCED